MAPQYDPHKGVTFHDDENEPLLPPAGNGEGRGIERAAEFRSPRASGILEPHAHLPIFYTIHRVRKDILAAIGM